MSSQPKADFAQWDHVDPLSVANAAWLWVGREPEPEHKVSGRGEAYAIFQRLKNCLTLHKVPGSDIIPKGYHRLFRDQYEQIAKAWGERPAFIFPEERKPRRRWAAGEPKKETVKGWEEDHDAVAKWLKTLGGTLKGAGDRAAQGTGRSPDAFLRNHRRYRRHVKRQNGKK